MLKTPVKRFQYYIQLLGQGYNSLFFFFFFWILDEFEVYFEQLP